jgi:hypothetical protein
MAADLEIRIGAELSEIKGALASLQKDLAGIGTAAQRSSDRAANSLQGIQGSLQSAGNAVRALVGAFAALQSVNVFNTLARQGIAFNSALEDSRLGIASIITSLGQLKNAQGDLVEGPEALSVALGLAEQQLFKLRVAGLETAASTRELAEAFQSAIGPGLSAGLNLDEIRTVTIQLTQAATALGVPTNQLAQEIRSILAAEIDINSRVAKTLGLTNEQVKAYQQQNTLAEELGKRLSGFAEAGREAANNFSVISSNAKEAVDALAGDIFSGFTEELKQGVIDATSGLFNTQQLTIDDSLKDAADLARELARNIGQGVGNALRAIVSLARELSRYIADNKESVDALVKAVSLLITGIGKIVGLALSLVGYFIDLGIRSRFFANIIGDIGAVLNGVAGAIKIIAVTFAGLTDSFVADAVLMKEAFLAIFSDDTIDQAIQRRNAKVNAALQAVKNTIAQINAEQKRGAAIATPATPRANSAVTGGSVAGVRNSNTTTEKGKNDLIKAQLDARERLLSDAAKRELSILEQLYEDAKLSIAQYYDQRNQLELAELDRAIAIERERANLGKVERVKALADIELLERQKFDVVTKAARQRAAGQRALDQQLEQARIQQLQNEGNIAAAERLRLETQYRELLQRLRAEGNAAGIELVQNLINVGAARAEFQKLEQEFDKVIERLQQKQQTNTSNVTSGLITPAQGAQQSAADRRAAIDQLTVLNQKLQELAVRTNDPLIIQGAERLGFTLRTVAQEAATGWQAAMQSLRASLDEMNRTFEQSAVNAGVTALEGFFMNLVDGSQSAADALRGFVRSFALSMAQIAARALATFIVLRTLDAIYPGLGQATAAMMGGGARVNHAGGMAGTGPIRQVNPLLFAGAPRYHSGGMVGLKPGEVPAILQTGEEVLSRRDPRNAANGGGGSNVRIINTIDPELAAEYFNSPAGEKTFVNLISRNSATLRNVLA